MARQTIPYPHNTTFPAVIPSRGQRYFKGQDTAFYIAVPGEDFNQPYIAIPGGRAFVWPLGVEGFDYSLDATLGVHKYMGSKGVEVSVVHLGTQSITMTGIFPGHTSVANMHALRDILLAESPEQGKILHLPLVFSKVLYVQHERSSFSHPPEERTQDINYEVVFQRITASEQAGSPNSVAALIDAIPSTASARGLSTRAFIVVDGITTLRGIAQALYGDGSRWNEIYIANQSYFDSQDIPSYQLPTMRLPVGLTLRY